MVATAFLDAIGEGGMGVVYRVEDRQLADKVIALKVIAGKVVTAELLSLFRAEFRLMAKLTHPNIPAVYDFGPLQGSPDHLFTLEWVDGQPIDARQERTWQEVIELLVPVCRALSYVHSRNIVHRDLKPQNVMVGRDGRVMVLDFGLAGARPAAGAFFGTPSYMAPEMLDPSRVDHRADLYCLGIVAYELLCRRVPFSGVGMFDLLQKHAQEPLVFDAAASVPEWLREIVHKLCAKKPAERYRSANAVIEAFNRGGGLGYALQTDETTQSYLLSSQLVGREKELESLIGFVEQRTRGNERAPILFLSGPSGVGKSRLMREVRHHAQMNSLAFVETNCFAGSSVDFGPVADVVAQLVRLCDAAGELALLDRFAQDIG
jgi:serine/threonine protein kinase